MKSVEKPQFSQSEPVELPLNGKRLIVFDMDETLIHCVDDIDEECPQHVISIQFDDEPHPVDAGINIRPYALDCLWEAKKLFYVVVFTASM